MSGSGMICGMCRSPLTPMSQSTTGYCHVISPQPWHAPVPIPVVPRTKLSLRKVGDVWRIGLDGDERASADWIELRKAMPKSMKVILKSKYATWEDALMCVRSAIWISRNIGGIATLTKGFGS